MAKMLTTEEIADLAALCMEAAEEKKAEKVISLKIGEVSSIADYFVLCSAASDPQMRAIAHAIEDAVREKMKIKPTTRDGESSTGWMIIDYGAVIVHIMTEEVRERYQLESLWSDAPNPEAIGKLRAVRD